MFRKLLYLTSFVVVLSIMSSARGQVGQGILYEYWFDITGTAVTDLTNNPRYPDSPDMSEWRTDFDSELDPWDNYGTRARGYIYPPVTGDYTFWISGDDFCELWLSTDDDPANITMVAEVPGWSAQYEWGKYPEQKSNAITLQAGQRYYIEALQKEAGGGDTLTVGWGGPTIGAGPVIIEGQYLEPFITSFADVMRAAREPNPADGSIYPDTWASMTWTAGYTAESHDVYFSDNLIDVQDRAADAFIGNQPSTDFVVGFPGFPFPDGLVAGTTYYWAIDEIEADGTKIEGNIWSFKIPPMKAYNPNPPDGAKYIAPETDLSFAAGFDAILHTIYFGDNFDDVNNAAGGAPKALTTFDPGTLELEKTYYWRVDEFVPPNTHRGDVWSFTTTLPGLGTIVQDVWNNLDGTDLNTLKDSTNFPNSPDETTVLDEFSTAIDFADNYGGRITGWLYVPATGEYTFWLTTDDQGELWLSTDDDPDNIELIAYVKDSPTATGGWAASTEWTKYPTQKSAPVTLQAGNKYYIETLWKEGGGGDHCRVAWEGPGIPTRTIIPGTNLSPYEPVQAFGPNPGNGAVDISQTTALSFKAGINAASHEIYFGSDEDTVTNATKSSPEFKGTGNLGDESYDPGKLEWNTTYFWRVDEVNNSNPASPWIGKTWSFTTANFIIVDDMESYNDLNPDEPGSNRIYLAWADGFDNPAVNGSIVGYDSAPFAEKTIVHGGKQSMPFFYDNGVGKSEATLTLTDVRNWTENGVDTLKIWYRGNPGGFVEDPEGTYTLTGAGTDVWGTADEFRFAYKQLSGDGEITARVIDVGTGSNSWAKAGVMIRETLDPSSKHMIMAMTGGDGGGIAFQGRQATGGSSTSFHGDVTASPPYWVRLTRQGSTITAYSSADGVNWQLFTDTSPDGNHTNPINVQMTDPVFIGLFITSHAAGESRTAMFDNVQITGSVSPTWTHEAIGATMAANDPDAMYVALNGGTKVYNDNPNAALVTNWTEWNIDLQAFGVNLSNVNTITIGLDNSNSLSGGGSGLIFFDDIQLHSTTP